MTDERATAWERANRQEMVERIAQAVQEDRLVEVMPGVFLRRSAVMTEAVHGIAEPAFAVIAQGHKEIVVGEKRFHYDPAHYLLNTVELPIVSQVVQATKEEPYLSFRLNLDPAIVGSILFEAGHLIHHKSAEVRAMHVSRLDASLLDATVRLLRLLDTPEDAPVLAPLIIREIVYRLLKGEQGGRLRHLVSQGGYANRIARAVEQIRKDFDKPLRIDNLAREIGMSTSSLHYHFKEVTALTPLQYQKQLRLQEARRLMLGEDMDATTAGYQVGYDDPAYFTKQYKQLFGLPPMRDVGRLRQAALDGTDGYGLRRNA